VLVIIVILWSPCWLGYSEMTVLLDPRTVERPTEGSYPGWSSLHHLQRALPSLGWAWHTIKLIWITKYYCFLKWLNDGHKSSQLPTGRLKNIVILGRVVSRKKWKFGPSSFLKLYGNSCVLNNFCIYCIVFPWRISFLVFLCWINVSTEIIIQLEN
jgi:hypothetical protein